MVDTSGFTGLTLAATGLSFLVPLTKLKELNVSVPDKVSAVAVAKTDIQFVGFTWLMLLIFLFVWSSSCYVSIKHPDLFVFGMPAHLAIGSIAYLLSLIMTFIKEKI
jgi:hypothetical protein